MKSIQDSITSWATLLATLISLIGLIESRPWLVVVGAFSAIASVGAIFYARRERLALRSATVRVEGRSIDSLNVANLQRRINRSLTVQEVHRRVEIRGQDLLIESRCSGYCRANRETSLEFSIDSDNNIPFDELDCFAFDLLGDPAMRHRIKPLLIGSDGNSKKLAVPFLNALTAERPFAVLLKCSLPGCMKSGVEYYASTLSFDQATVNRYSLELKFVGEIPVWLRVYECDPLGTATLLKDLSPRNRTPGFVEYIDAVDNVNARSTRIYVFRRMVKPIFVPR